MGYILVEMYGNVGLIDDDLVVVMCYIEVRFFEIVNYVIGDIRKNIVKFVFNFDDLEKEFVVMLVLIFNLLINGLIGIVLGFVIEMLLYNLNEILDVVIVKVKNFVIEFSKLVKII